VAVEDGLAFCRHCGAPQIRVSLASAEMRESVPLAESVASLPSSLVRNSPAATIQWGQAWSGAALASMVAVLGTMTTPAGFGLSTLAAGALAVALYRRKVPHAALTSSIGAKLGALSGGIGWSLFAIMMGLQWKFGDTNEIRAAVIETLNQSAARSGDPQAQALIERFKTPDGIIVVMVMGVALMLLIFVGLSSLGGTIGASVMTKKSRI